MCGDRRSKLCQVFPADLFRRLQFRRQINECHFRRCGLPARHDEPEYQAEQGQQHGYFMHIPLQMFSQQCTFSFEDGS